MRRKTKIVATLGPSSNSKRVIQDLLQTGMNVARLNFSHGAYEQHEESVHTLRDLSNRLGIPVTIMQDLQGPKIRTGILPDEGIVLTPGHKITLTTDPVTGAGKLIPVDFPEMTEYVHQGSRVLLADGQMELLIHSVNDNEMEAEVTLGGILKSHKGVNIPGAKLDIPGFTEKDERDLAFGMSQSVDAVAMSFVRTPADIARVRAAIGRIAPERMDTPIIAKLERPEALDNLEAIVDIADGVMVARGDLGVEMSPEDVPIAQKRIIESANRHAKVVITATQMLESMIENPRPTRAEASDVANAIFDGTDAVMLSGETAVGRYPAKSVQMMSAIIMKAEEHLDKWGHWKQLPTNTMRDDALYLARAASELAHDRSVAAIAVFSKSGKTILQVSKTRPSVPILAFTSSEPTYRRLSMFWGVVPHLVPQADNMETLISHVEAGLLAETRIQPGQQVVLICGFPVNAMRPSNLILLHTVGR